MDSNVAGNQTGAPWTNEKHLHFLNSMEATFVRTMLENNGSSLLRLDRYLPDSSESTLDLKSQRRKKHAILGEDDVVIGSRTRMDGRTDKRIRRRLSASHQRVDSSQDQVVPQLEKGAADKGESDPPNVAITPVAPPN